MGFSLLSFNKDLTEFGTQKTYALDFPMLEMRMGFGHRKKPHARDLARRNV